MPCLRPCRNLKKVSSSFQFFKHESVDWLHLNMTKIVCPEAELMLLGFISLLLTVSQTAIRHICVPPALVSNMFPCKKPLEEEHHAPETSHSLVFNTRHLLSTGASPDHCTTKVIFPLKLLFHSGCFSINSILLFSSTWLCRGRFL